MGRARFSALRVLFALALLGLAIGWSGKAACLQETPLSPSPGIPTIGSGETGARPSPDETARLNWDRQRELFSLCYTDIPPTYTRQHLADGVPFWTSWKGTSADGRQITHRWAAPVGTGMVAYLAARSTAGWQWMHVHWGVPSAISPVVFFNMIAVLLALCWLATIWALVKLAGERRWAVWVAALSPVIFVHAFTAFELLTVALVMVGLLAWDRRRRWLTGVLLGLATTTAIWPLLVLLALLLASVGRTRPDSVTPRDALLRTVVAALATWIAVNLPVMIGASSGWLQYWSYWAARAPEPDSVYGAIANLTKLHLNVTVVNVISLVLAFAVITSISATVLRAPRRFDVYSIAFLLIAGVLMVSKVWSPQSTLWLVPLAVLAVKSSRILMAWMVIEALTWVPRMGVYLAPEHDWLPPQFYTLAVTVRLVALMGVCLYIVWEHYEEEPSPLSPNLNRSPVPVR
ncbi:hypothetical protein GOARA_006_00380 [Gordonia araii NBRC 100433]|uniref:DUF2029 domain-containing protein n=1 Tax=Gordonia araii NBRC 100433 TaxID=1073574 RepID=G7GXF4_9ACTN|nr:hypothetical protein GOARA_006_00380 [Gordonia araii NBRC 100433]